LSRFDGEMKPQAEASIELEELLAAFGTAPRAGPGRNDAMAHYLSGAEGWREALAALRGTFAGHQPGAARLTDGEDK